MASIWNSRQELLDEIEATKTEIKSRRGVSRYMLSTGHGTQSVDNRPLSDLMDWLDQLNQDLEEMDNPNGGILAVDFDRTIGGIH